MNGTCRGKKKNKKVEMSEFNHIWCHYGSWKKNVSKYNTSLTAA